MVPPASAPADLEAYGAIARVAVCVGEPVLLIVILRALGIVY